MAIVDTHGEPRGPYNKRRPWRMLLGGAPSLIHSDILEPGTSVAVRNRYVGSWNGGFEVVEPHDDGYLIRRISDDAVLPQIVAFDDVRQEVR